MIIDPWHLWELVTGSTLLVAGVDVGCAFLMRVTRVATDGGGGDD